MGVGGTEGGRGAGSQRMKDGVARPSGAPRAQPHLGDTCRGQLRKNAAALVCSESGTEERDGGGTSVSSFLFNPGKVMCPLCLTFSSSVKCRRGGHLCTDLCSGAKSPERASCCLRFLMGEHGVLMTSDTKGCF